ncbi:hypothetical protein [Nonomuraea indica]|uniref:hypothetical protein n=1 Tax=Nonomuraea indica TaxID=1581193 RepID=UPI000C7D2753|nr:hypothetical protein [Nonomuraea indica]
MISNEVALAEVVLKVMTERLKQAKANADAELSATALPGDRTSAVLPDGTVAGMVGHAKGRTTARVTDRLTLTAWVQETYPSEVEMVPAIRPAFEKVLLDSCKANGANVDANGYEVPGITVGQGEPYPTTKVADGAEDAIASAYQSGQLAEVMERFTRPAIEAGERGE